MTSKELRLLLKRKVLNNLLPRLQAVRALLSRAGCLLVNLPPRHQEVDLLVERVLWAHRRRCLLHKLRQYGVESCVELQAIWENPRNP